MAEIVINVCTTASDWKEFQKLWVADFKKERLRSWGQLLVDVFLAVALVVGIVRFRADIHWPTATVVAILAFLYTGYIVGAYIRATEAATPSKDGLFLGRHTYRFAPERIYSTGELYSSEYSWNLVHTVRETDDLIILMIDSMAALILPKRDIDEPDELIEHIKGYCNNQP